MQVGVDEVAKAIKLSTQNGAVMMSNCQKSKRAKEKMSYIHDSQDPKSFSNL